MIPSSVWSRGSSFMTGNLTSHSATHSQPHKPYPMCHCKPHVMDDLLPHPICHASSPLPAAGSLCHRLLCYHLQLMAIWGDLRPTTPLLPPPHPRLMPGLFGWNPGKTAWLRQHSQALDFVSLGLDGAAWPVSCLAGSNQTGLTARLLPSWTQSTRFRPVA